MMDRLVRSLVVVVCATAILGCVAGTALAGTALAATPGRLDRFFSGDGRQTAFIRGGIGYAVAIDGHDRIVVAGYTLTRHTDLALARFLPNGTPDDSFGGDGRVTTDLGGSDYAFDVAIHPDGGIVVAGERDTRHGSRAAVVRYHPKGARNRDFGGGDGIVLTSFGKRYQGANAVVIGASGNITIGGFTSNGSTAKWALARFGPRGVLDKDFGGDGKVTVDLAPADEQINDLAIADGGRVVATGYAASGITPRFALARFLLSGSLDKRFGRRGGVNLVDVSKGSDIAFALGQGSGGSLVAAGYAQNRRHDDWAIVAFGPRGRLNQHFGGDGKRVLQLGPRYEFAYGTAVQPNGKVVVVGRATRKGSGDDMGVFRFKPNGDYDRNFSGDGRAFVNFFGGSDTGRDVVLQSNGKIVVAGDATDHGTRRMAVARLVGH
jgi:uncharacterized delta-60 repeat protein